MTQRCALKKVSKWRMIFLRIKKSSKQKRHCRKTIETGLLPKGTVSLRLLDFQKRFNRRIKNTIIKNFAFQRNDQSMEMRSGIRDPRIFFALINREQCGALKKVDFCFFWIDFTVSPQKDNSRLNTSSIILKQQTFYGRNDKSLAKYLP